MASSPLRIVFVTGNAKKLEEVTAILGTQHASRFVLDSVSLDLPELQGHPEDVAKEKARLASERCGGTRVILTVAHVDHDERNNDLANLRALCQRCHLVLDARDNAVRRRKAASEQAGQSELPLGLGRGE